MILWTNKDDWRKVLIIQNRRWRYLASMPNLNTNLSENPHTSLLTLWNSENKFKSYLLWIKLWPRKTEVLCMNIVNGNPTLRSRGYPKVNTTLFPEQLSQQTTHSLSSFTTHWLYGKFNIGALKWGKQISILKLQSPNFFHSIQNIRPLIWL